MAGDGQAERNTNVRDVPTSEMVLTDCLPVVQSGIEPFSGNGWAENSYLVDFFLFPLTPLSGEDRKSVAE